MKELEIDQLTFLGEDTIRDIKRYAEKTGDDPLDLCRYWIVGGIERDSELWAMMENAGY